MTSSPRSSTLVSEFLSEMDPVAPKGSRGRSMMERKLRRYLYWKGENARQKQRRQQPQFSAPRPQPSSKSYGEVSEALKKKDKTRQERSANRRRLRGGAPASVVPSKPVDVDLTLEVEDEAGEIATLYVNVLVFLRSILILNHSLGNQPSDLLLPSDADDLLLKTILSSGGEIDYDMHYGLLVPSQTIVVRAYTDDTDDQILAELQPKFIVMFEPNLDFVRRIEVSPLSERDWHL